MSKVLSARTRAKRKARERYLRWKRNVLRQDPELRAQARANSMAQATSLASAQTHRRVTKRKRHQALAKTAQSSAYNANRGV